jgi:hypothetical protein
VAGGTPSSTARNLVEEAETTAVALEGIANEQQLEVGVNGPGGANRVNILAQL